MNSIAPLISALCLTYNRPEWLPRAVEIFLQQTWPKKELLIMDASDEDKRVKLPADGRVHRTFFSAQQSGSGNRNKAGILQAKGDLVVYYDDDDWSHKDRLLEQAIPILEGRASMTGIQLGAVVCATLPGPRFWKLGRGPNFSKRLSDNIHGPQPGKPPLRFSDGTTMFKRSLLQGPDDPALGLSKVPFQQEILSRDNRTISLALEHLYVYVRHGGNIYPLDESAWTMTPTPAPAWVPAEQYKFWQFAPWKGAGDGR
ncbi:MAG: glycosyltransferase family 2 protein [Candidatus Polarisedimenticolia bacterium]